MLLTACYAYLTLSTAWRNHRQKTLVMNALRCHGGKASISFRKFIQEGAMAERRSSSCLCEVTDKLPIITQFLHEKRGKQMIVVHPKQCVNLSKDWTSFIGTGTASVSYKTPDVVPPNSASNPDSFVFVLLEASPPKKDRQGRLNLRKVARERVVKLSGLTTPLAWKSGEPFGILVRASPSNFGLVGSAYLEGVLELDDGLLVEQIVCVDIIGEPFNLVNQDPNQPSPSPTNPPRSPFYRSTSESILSHRSLIAGVSRKDARPLRRKHSQEFMRKLEQQQRRSISRKTSSDSSDPGGVSFDTANPGLLDDEVLVDIVPVGQTLTSSPGTNELRESGDSATAKPPNVLVYAASDETVALSVTVFLEKFLHRDRYIVYRLEERQVLAHPWAENCLLLVIAVDAVESLPDGIVRKFLSYVRSGGSVFVVPPENRSLSKPRISLVQFVEGDARTVDFKGICDVGPPSTELFPGGTTNVLAVSEGNPVMTETKWPEERSGRIISSKIHLDLSSLERLTPDTEAFLEVKQSNEARYSVVVAILEELGLKCGPSEIPALTHGYLMGVNEKSSDVFLRSIQSGLVGNTLASRSVSLDFYQDPSDAPTVTPDLLPILTGQRSVQHGGGFNFDLYRENLTSRVLGNVVLYAEVVPTTMTLFEGFMFKVPEDVSVVAIATRMTQGKGRGGNKWISPAGCAMFSVHVRVPFGTVLADKLPFLQHIASAGVVEAVRTLQGYEDIDLRLKWPNDVYFGDKMKLGGVIVNSSCLDNVYHAIIGCGFNVNNGDPTICLNDLIRHHNAQTDANLPLLDVEQLIARTISKMEDIISTFQARGEEEFLELYYRRWLHSDTKVRLNDENGPEVTVKGLDKSGFLLVSDQQGALHSVQPDGNSFDMTKNLIRVKERVK